MEFIARFIEIDTVANEISLNPGMKEYFKKCREDLKKRKAIRDIVEKKKKAYLEWAEYLTVWVSLLSKRSGWDKKINNDLFVFPF